MPKPGSCRRSIEPARAYRRCGALPGQRPEALAPGILNIVVDYFRARGVLFQTAKTRMMRETFARFLDEHSTMARVRAAMPGGFDPVMWRGLAELGAFSLRVPEALDGLGLGLMDAVVLMEEAGRTLASGPVAETLVSARLLAQYGGEQAGSLLGDEVPLEPLHD